MVKILFSRIAPAVVLCAVVLLSALLPACASCAPCAFEQGSGCAVPAPGLQALAGVSPGGISPGAGSPEPSPQIKMTTVTFPVDSFLIPFDANQADVVKAFGLVHALLRNGTTVNRIIEPLPPPNSSNVNIKTILNPAGADYAGGPVLVLPGAAASVNAAKPFFPTVTTDKVTEEFTSGAVYSVASPTKILIIKGNWGETEVLLDDMKIPYDIVWPFELYSAASRIHSYNLIVDDCEGYGGMPDPSAIENFTKFVNDGKEIIFTDQAIQDFVKMPWGSKLTKIDGVTYHNVINTTFYNIADFPGQYAGKTKVKIWQMHYSMMAKNPAADVKIMADCKDYPGQTATMVIACYFYWGEKNGIVEFFAYHPSEQEEWRTGDPDSYRLSAFLYGNKFLHTLPPDAGVFPRSGASPVEIDVKDTGLLPSEQATINLSVQALKADITPANQVKLNFELMPHIDNVTGSFSRDPASIIINPNGSKSLKWIVANVPSEQYYNITFKITSTKAGSRVWINAAGRSNVTYIDMEGASRAYQLVPLWVKVRGAAPEISGATALLACGAMLAACCWAATRRRK